MAKLFPLSDMTLACLLHPAKKTGAALSRLIRRPGDVETLVLDPLTNPRRISPAGCQRGCC
jgi:hypothetical protein